MAQMKQKAWPLQLHPFTYVDIVIRKSGILRAEQL
jgi:hypothetical protein